MTLFIPTTVNSAANEIMKKAYFALQKEVVFLFKLYFTYLLIKIFSKEMKWKRDSALLEHTLLNGIDGLDMKSFSEYSSYIVEENLPLNW